TDHPHSTITPTRTECQPSRCLGCGAGTSVTFPHRNTEIGLASGSYFNNAKISADCGEWERSGEGTRSTGRGKMGSLLAGIGLAYLLSFAYLYWRCRDHLSLTKYLSNHALLLSPLNFVFAFFSRGAGRKPVFAPTIVPGLELIRQNYDVIRGEAKALLDAGV